MGFVSDVAERDGWHEATFVLNMDKPLADVARELLRVGTPVSLGAKSVRRDESLADLGLAIPVKRHTIAFLEEVSILSPGFVPGFKGAKVIRITERGTALDRMRERQERESAQAKPKPPKPSAPKPTATVADEVIYNWNGKVYRYRADQLDEIARMDRIIGYVSPSGSQEIHHQPGSVIRRPGIGQVLGVR